MLHWLVQFMDRLLVPRILQKDRTFLIQSASKIFKELNVKPIPVIFDDCHSCYYNSKEQFVGIGLNFINTNLDDVFDYVDGEFKSQKDKLFFVIAHEIAHHLQFTKHHKWTSKAINDWSYINAITIGTHPKQYRELKLEANADKIALIVSKKLGYALDKDRLIW